MTADRVGWVYVGEFELCIDGKASWSIPVRIPSTGRYVG